VTAQILLGISEVSILALTLLISVGLSVYVVKQTQKHFALEHSQKFIERFNNDEMIAHQRAVDEWFNAGKSARLLVNDQGLSDVQLNLRDSVVAICNFFQELGTADKHLVVDRLYTWDVFGAIIRHYWAHLFPFISDLRHLRERHTLFQDFEDLAHRMADLDEKHVVRPKEDLTPDDSPPPIYLFGYGSLINKNSMERTLDRDIDAKEIRIAWLNGYRRTWNLYDMVVANGKTMPMAFYNLEPDPGSRCNGVLIPIDVKDLENFDIRERQYDRVKVSESIWPDMQGDVYTYVGKPEARKLPPDTIVAESYEKLVDDGAHALGERFAEEFYESTLAHSLKRYSGNYRFKDEAQERVT
jgi:cation transport regulator ChaC